ncbi:RrF2 family transcriptional regulator [Phyllobacterium bourgognense]|uniref:BadM/Rrf2 family transcriptional regulator n=1 Tax=Phyllobacterium bourgognense TaxID=314236 RepID=A0A368YVL2_9HYPH|nr:Rrf2 family transcriptional regulator [Phyllobacterium bourgognense]RCW82234.1 BadM/Rrf2 family transcriptional regulator [Phyllobacterium bourgognense]
MNTNATKPRDRVDAATHSARPPSLYGATVEYGIHCMMYLIQPRATPVSSRDLAELQGVPVTLMARIMPRLEKAGIVVSTSGINGGYRLAKEPRKITVLDIVDAIDGRKNVFDCKDVRKNCVLFAGDAPTWMTSGVCGIHAVMLRAQKSMRQEMARTTLEDLSGAFDRRAPAAFGEDVGAWLDNRAVNREATRISAVKDSSRRRVRGGQKNLGPQS